MRDVSIGSGIDSLTDQPKNQAVAITADKVEKDIPLIKSESEVKIYHSAYDMHRSFEGSLTVDVMSSKVGVESGYKDEKSKNAYEIFYVLRVIENVKQTKMKAPYSFQSENLLDQEFQNHADGFYRWDQKYGSSFVNSITYGREATIIARCVIDSEQKKRDFHNKLGVTEGKVTIGADFNYSLQEALEKFEHEIEIHSAGLALPGYKIAITKNELIDYLNKLSSDDTKKAEPAPISYSTLPYTVISSSPLLSTLSNSLTAAKEILNAIAKCKESVAAALYCFSFENDVGIDDEEAKHDRFYAEQEKQRQKLMKILHQLNQAESNLLKRRFEIDDFLDYKMLINESIRNLRSCFDAIEGGITNSTLIRWIPPEKIQHVKHTEFWEDDFELVIPAATQRLRFEFVDAADQNENEIAHNPKFEKRVHLRQRARSDDSSKKLEKKTILEDITDGTEVDVTCFQSEQRDLFFKPALKTSWPHKKAYTEKKSKEHAAYGIAVYAKHFYRRPNPQLIPGKLPIDQILQRAQSDDYNKQDLEACILALSIHKSPNRNLRRYVLPTNGSPVLYSLLPPIANENQLKEHLDKTSVIVDLDNNNNNRKDAWDEILPIIKARANADFKILFPYKINDNGYPWAAVELVIKKVTNNAQPAVTTYTATLCAYHPNRAQGALANPNPLTNIQTWLNTLLPTKLSAPVQVTLSDGGYFNANANHVNLANNLSILNTVRDIQHLIEDVDPMQNRMTANQATQIKQQQFDLVYQAKQADDEDANVKLYEYLTRHGEFDLNTHYIGFTS